VIPNFLDCAEYRRKPDAAIRERLCPAGSCDAVVMHISNFRPVKRVGMVLDVFKRIRERIRARLVMIGDGPDRGTLEQRVIDEGLGESVTFLGEQLDVVPWLSAADLFLLPSAQESFGLAALEAMACQVPVVASRVGGLPDVIEDGVTGFTCDQDDVAAMAERGAEILGDPARREAMGKAAAKSVSRRFCVDVVVPQYEQYYRDILALPMRSSR
jgi:N-acetyl-alpha-D-glucosaminyl L-malate synthase BshA